eukprot:12961214-Heterocapsa_arctica.AAC.1
MQTPRLAASVPKERSRSALALRSVQAHVAATLIQVHVDMAALFTATVPPMLLQRPERTTEEHMMEHSSLAWAQSASEP